MADVLSGSTMFRLGRLAAVTLRSGERTFSEAASSSSSPPTLGQAHPSTHPHLLRTRDEVNPLVTRQELAARRAALAQLVRTDEGSDVRADDTNTSYSSRKLLAGHKRVHRHLVVVPAAQRAFMYDNIPFPFRQNSDFR